MSYPVFRKERLEYRLQHVTNPADLKRSYAELSLLQTVIQQGNPFCNDCVFDCQQCSWLRDPATSLASSSVI